MYKAPRPFFRRAASHGSSRLPWRLYMQNGSASCSTYLFLYGGIEQTTYQKLACHVHMQAAPTTMYVG